MRHHCRFYNQHTPLLVVLSFLQYDVPFKANPLFDVVFSSFPLSGIDGKTTSKNVVPHNCADEITKAVAFAFCIYANCRCNSYHLDLHSFTKETQ